MMQGLLMFLNNTFQMGGGFHLSLQGKSVRMDSPGLLVERKGKLEHWRVFSITQIIKSNNSTQSSL